MTEQWIGDILDGVAVLVVLVLILTVVTWYYGHKILKLLQQMARPSSEERNDD